MAVGDPEVTSKQKDFLRKFLVCANATEAARQAGYTHPNIQGPRLLKKPEVWAAIQKATDKKLVKAEVDADRTIRELACVGLSDIRLLLDARGAVLKPSEWPDAIAAAVSSYETEERFEGRGKQRSKIVKTKLRLWSKTEALKSLMSHLAPASKGSGRMGIRLPDGTMAVAEFGNPDLSVLSDEEVKALRELSERIYEGKEDADSAA